MEQSILLLLLRVCAFVSCLFFSFVVLSREVFLSVREEEEEEEEERERERERERENFPIAISSKRERVLLLNK
jgi:hypothetical protein